MAPRIWDRAFSAPKSAEAMAKPEGLIKLAWVSKADMRIVEKCWHKWDERRIEVKVRDNEIACQVIWKRLRMFRKPLRSADLRHVVLEVSEAKEALRRSRAQTW